MLVVEQFMVNKVVEQFRKRRKIKNTIYNHKAKAVHIHNPHQLRCNHRGKTSKDTIEPQLMNFLLRPKQNTRQKAQIQKTRGNATTIFNSKSSTYNDVPINLQTMKLISWTITQRISKAFLFNNLYQDLRSQFTSTSHSVTQRKPHLTTTLIGEKIMNNTPECLDS